jgi:RNA polymerase sigma-70 factor (ECF subfamily)
VEPFWLPLVVSWDETVLVKARALHAFGEEVRTGGGDLARAALSHLDALHHFARYLAGSDAEAEDLVQDTYARALGAESSFVAGSNVRAWLFRILRNVFIDGRRRAKLSPVVAGADADLTSADPLFGDAELDALRRVVSGNIERALAALSPDARAVVLLDLEGFSESETAEVLGCAAGTVKSRLSRARGALRELLAEYGR